MPIAEKPFHKINEDDIYKIWEVCSRNATKSWLMNSRLLVNPIGWKDFIDLRGPQYSYHMDFAVRSASRLLAFDYLLECESRKALLTPPVDPLTGKPFLVRAAGESIHISTEYAKILFSMR
jgi:hypothetical protein